MTLIVFVLQYMYKLEPRTASVSLVPFLTRGNYSRGQKSERFLVLAGLNSELLRFMHVSGDSKVGIGLRIKIFHFFSSFFLALS
jgi:hypothetical protein